MQSVYEAAGGSEGLVRLAEAWHRQVMGDEIVSHAFSHGFHPQHSERLAAVREGRETEAEQARFLTEGLSRLFRGEPVREVGFGIEIEVFERVQRPAT